MIRVFIIAPAITVRAGLRSLLTDDRQIEVIGEAASPVERFEGSAEPDVVIWSPELSTVQDVVFDEVTDLLPGGTTALLLIHDDPSLIEKLSGLKIRAWGFLSPESTQAELIAAVNAINEGLVVANPIWLQYLSNGQTFRGEGETEMVEALTGRELEVLQLLALGLTNKQIAVRLGISAHTVKFHVSSIFGKMRTTNRMETVNRGFKLGLILL
ncbi:MAG: hypothetical protein A2136_01395 [Chloroflexi bacterium RBG_16_54_11]|nr:MAG: hypothetical protein A2136_01395 [Chloroflexi bacterium RBG_16_54_11]